MQCSKLADNNCMTDSQCGKHITTTTPTDDWKQEGEEEGGGRVGARVCLPNCMTSAACTHIVRIREERQICVGGVNGREQMTLITTHLKRTKSKESETDNYQTVILGTQTQRKRREGKRTNDQRGLTNIWIGGFFLLKRPMWKHCGFGEGHQKAAAAVHHAMSGTNK